MPNPEGLELIEELVEFATQDEFVYPPQVAGGRYPDVG